MFVATLLKDPTVPSGAAAIVAASLVKIAETPAEPVAPSRPSRSLTTVIVSL